MTKQIPQVTHRIPDAGTDPAGLALALEVAAELRAPARRAPEVAPPPPHRKPSPGRGGHRRTVRG
ncbi:hypothetical protein [Streptomyces hirsutus]|uniref:hypothetical protein n=1 Tax=Streptomyces hirsutus TaxID=35620 RepID=UPI0006E35CC1|nr:hypothetical protein [Streptomyces hirsutus]